MPHLRKKHASAQKQRGIFGIDDFLVATIGGSIIGGIFGQETAENTNAAQVGLSREQMAFQKEMSSTAYQRATADMKAAGLNPILAYSQGGASAPMGSMPQIQNTGAAAMQSAAQAAAITQAIQQVTQSQAQTDAIRATADKVRSETLTNDINTARALADTELSRQQSGKEFWSANKLRLEGPGAGYDSERRREEFHAMEKGGFTASVNKLKEEARIAALERAKQEITKGPYDILETIIGPVKNSAKREFERLKSPRSGRKWWEQHLHDVTPQGSW